jgi:hypothetical protein
MQLDGGVFDEQQKADKNVAYDNSCAGGTIACNNNYRKHCIFQVWHMEGVVEPWLKILYADADFAD